LRFFFKMSTVIPMNPKTKNILTCLELLKKATKDMTKPMSVMLVEDFGRDPFIILISCLLSLRAKDTVTYPVSKILFKKVRTPGELLKVPLQELEEIFYPLGFYRKKAITVKAVSKELIDRFGGEVPSTEEELLSLKGVGRKTANLVLGMAFNKPAICVDTHVHRLSNRLGWVATQHPDQTEQELKRLVPEEYWIDLNNYLVMWGQNICVPISPFCSRCVLSPLCPKLGVTKSR
jgi:endonuclease III